MTELGELGLEARVLLLCCVATLSSRHERKSAEIAVVFSTYVFYSITIQVAGLFQQPLLQIYRPLSMVKNALQIMLLHDNLIICNTLANMYLLAHMVDNFRDGSM